MVRRHFVCSRAGLGWRLVGPWRMQQIVRLTTRPFPMRRRLTGLSLMPSRLRMPALWNSTLRRHSSWRRCTHLPRSGRWKLCAGGIAADGGGNIYGTLYYDGLCEWCGLVYMLKKPAAGQSKWTFIAIHKFNRDAEDGIAPIGKLLTSTRRSTADHRRSEFQLRMRVGFKLRPLNAGKPQWAYSRLYRFKNPADGRTPIGV